MQVCFRIVCFKQLTFLPCCCRLFSMVLLGLLGYEHNLPITNTLPKESISSILLSVMVVHMVHPAYVKKFCNQFSFLMWSSQVPYMAAFLGVFVVFVFPSVSWPPLKVDAYMLKKACSACNNMLKGFTYNSQCSLHNEPQWLKVDVCIVQIASIVSKTAPPGEQVFNFTALHPQSYCGQHV